MLIQDSKGKKAAKQAEKVPKAGKHKKLFLLRKFKVACDCVGYFFHSRIIKSMALIVTALSAALKTGHILKSMKSVTAP